MEKGDNRITLQITDISAEGKGIGRTEDGLVIFVQGALPGDKVVCEIIKKKKHYGIGKMAELLFPSPERAERFCPYQDSCGGCPYGELRYSAQLRIKEKHVKDALNRIGGLREIKTGAILSMKNPESYRNKAVCAISGGFARTKIGFHQRGTGRIVNCTDCRIQMPPAMAVASALREFMIQDNISAFDSRTKKGLMRQLIVRTAEATGEVMVIFVINGKGIPNGKKLVSMVDDAVNALPERADGIFFSLESVYLNQNRDPDQLLGRKSVHLAGTAVIHEEIGGVKFEISPYAFYQVNPVMMKSLYEEIRRLADLKPGDVLLDLYCGAGSIGIWLAKKMEGKISVFGIEANKEAVVQANRNAVINGIVNARYLCGAAETLLPELIRKKEENRSSGNAGKGNETLPSAEISLPKIDVSVVDPPRAGCDEKLLDALLVIQPGKILYVSCDPATLARDLRYLTDRGYRVQSVVPVDMFPQTAEVETVVLLECRFKRDLY